MREPSYAASVKSSTGALLLALAALILPAAAPCAPLSNIAAITARGFDVCALTTAGGAKCWGDNSYGQVGDGTIDNRSAATDVAGLSSGVGAIAVGAFHTCAVMAAGTVKCWGRNDFGQLGSAPSAARPAPVDVAALAGATAVAVGDLSTCALVPGVGVKCWGANLGSTWNGSLPTSVPGTSDAVTISAGDYYYCVKTASGAMRCWGQDVGGNLGLGPGVAIYVTPVNVIGLGVTAMATAPGLHLSHACAVVGGGVKCWGSNLSGDLGDGTSTYRPVPVDVAGLGSSVTSVAVGTGTSCAITTAGGVKCWGQDLTTPLASTIPPTDVAGLTSGVAAVALGEGYACALTTGGEVMCWGGSSHGEFGAGTAGSMFAAVPVAVPDLAAQVIDFAPLAEHDVHEVPFAVGATSTSTLPIVFASLTPSTCTAAGSMVTLVATGMCTIAAIQGSDSSHASADATQSFLVRDSTVPQPPRLANISTRGIVLGGADDVVIGGFVIGGSGSKTVAIVATGPSLAQFGIANPLADPSIELVRSSTMTDVATNDDWQLDPLSASQLRALGIAPTDPREAAMVVTLAPGAYTAIVRGGLTGGTGVALIGIYEVDHPETPLVNISTRARVLTGDNVMIAGFIVQGSGPQKVLITATGPSLAAFSVVGWLPNPTVTVVRSSDHSVVAVNDDWQDPPNVVANIQAAGFFSIWPSESAMLITLDPGAYTAIVSGVGGITGTSVVGVFAQ